MEGIKVIVKVGKKARTVIRNCKAIRVITLDELESQLDNSDINAVVLEYIHPDEIDRASEILDKFRKSGDNKRVYFNLENLESDAAGVADILDENILFKTQDIWDVIEKDFGVYTGTSLEKIKESQGDIDADFIRKASAFFDSSAQQMQDLFAESNEVLHNDIELPEIQNKLDIEEFSRTVIIEASQVTDSDTEPTNGEEARGVDGYTVAEGTSTTDIVDNPDSLDNTVTLKGNNDKEADKANNSNLLLSKLHTLDTEKKNLQSQLKSAQKRITKVNDIVKSLKADKALIENQFNKLLDSQVMLEENVSATEYQKMVLHADELQAQIKDLESRNSTKVTGLNDTIKAYETQISNLNTELTDAKSEIEHLKLKVVAVKSEGTAAVSANTMEMQAQIDLLEKDYESAKVEIRELRKQSVDNGSLIDKLTNQSQQAEQEKQGLGIELDIAVKSSSAKDIVIQNAISLVQTKLQEIDSLSNQINILNSEIELRDKSIADLNNSLVGRDNQITSLEDEIKGLESDKANLQLKVDGAEAEHSAATVQIRADLESLKIERSGLQSALSNLQNQLTYRTNQVQQLQSVLGPKDSNGQPLIIGKVALYENQIRELNSKVFNTHKSMSTLESKLSLAQNENKALAQQVESLKGTVKVLSSSGGAMNESAIIPQFSYAGRAKIINVFGTSSAGISSIAYAMANHLAANHTVVVLDFDLAYPKMEAYFDVRATMQTPIGIKTATDYLFSADIDNVINNLGRFMMLRNHGKSGNLYYLGGVTSKPDSPILVGTEYGRYLTAIGNLNLNGVVPDYIIIDSGKYGYSAINDQIIENIGMVASRNLVVLPHDQFDISRSASKIASKFNPSSLVWLVNKATSTNTSDIANVLRTNNFAIIPISQKLLGKRINMLNDVTIRDRLKTFITKFIE